MRLGTSTALLLYVENHPGCAKADAQEALGVSNLDWTTWTKAAKERHALRFGVAPNGRKGWFINEDVLAAQHDEDEREEELYQANKQLNALRTHMLLQCSLLLVADPNEYEDWPNVCLDAAHLIRELFQTTPAEWLDEAEAARAVMKAEGKRIPPRWSHAKRYREVVHTWVESIPKDERAAVHAAVIEGIDTAGLPSDWHPARRRHAMRRGRRLPRRRL